MISTVLSEQQSRAQWRPSTPEDRAAVHTELEVVLADPQFANSKRYPALLRYLVEHTLAGDVAQIKERTLGIEVFGRPATYDTTNDTVVRFTASEVRRRLATYYLRHEDHAIQISLPTGSYVPEFLRAEEVAPPRHLEAIGVVPAAHPAAARSEPVHGALIPSSESLPGGAPPRSGEKKQQVRTGRLRWRTAAVAVALLLLVGAGLWLLRARHVSTQQSAVDRFWAPLAHETRMPLIVAGGNIFSNNGYSGTETATRDVDYPFVSMQIASAMARVSAIVQREGSAVDVLAANATTLTDLRDRPLVLIGGYNNVWTSRLTSALPLRLASHYPAAILEGPPSGRRWERDLSQPYSAADDFALIGRYRDGTTGDALVIMAGLGRNGSEGAAQFLTDERRLQSLEQALGRSLDSVNFEAVLRVPVIQGRTGAPQIVTVRTW